MFMNNRSASAALQELAVNLIRAETLESIGDTVGRYCNAVFRARAAMMYVERKGSLQLASTWRSKELSTKRLAANAVQDTLKKGPAYRAFHTGAAVYKQRTAFWPMTGHDKTPVGVLALVLPNENQLSPALRHKLVHLAQILSTCVLRACKYHDALAARATAEDAIRQKEEFFSIVSHELRNPMMPILGWAVALSSGSLPADKQTLALDGIVRNVRALNALIDDLFDAASISSGKLRLNPTEIRIQDVAREVLAIIQPNAEARKLRISTDISGSIPPFIADSRRLRQALTNLLNNAVKFTPAGGSISLKISRRGGFAECIVSDTGKGIDRNFLPRIFERFSQEDHSLRNRSSGLGLGLSIVHEIIHLHGGSIRVRSDGTDRGSTFIVRLPLRRMRRHAGQRFTAPNKDFKSSELIRIVGRRTTL